MEMHPECQKWSGKRLFSHGLPRGTHAVLPIFRHEPAESLGVRLLRVVACYTHLMSKRLQVLLADDEMSDIRLLAQRERLTVGEWVRRTLREARAQKSVKDPAAKLAAIRRAVEYDFPTADIDQMLREIEQGYLS